MFRHICFLLVICFPSALADPIRELNVQVDQFPRSGTSMDNLFVFLVTRAKLPMVLEVNGKLWIQDTRGMIGQGTYAESMPRFDIDLKHGDTTAAQLLKFALSHTPGYTARPTGSFIHIMPESGIKQLDVTLEFGTQWMKGRPPTAEQALRQLCDAIALHWAARSLDAWPRDGVAPETMEELASLKDTVARFAAWLSLPPEERVSLDAELEKALEATRLRDPLDLLRCDSCDIVHQLLTRVETIAKASGDKCKAYLRMMNDSARLHLVIGESNERYVLGQPDEVGDGWRLGQPLSEKVDVAKRRYTIREALDAIVAQTPGGFWSASIGEETGTLHVCIGTAPLGFREMDEEDLMEYLGCPSSGSLALIRAQYGLSRYVEELLIHVGSAPGLAGFARRCRAAVESIVYIACMKKDDDGAACLKELLGWNDPSIAAIIAENLRYSADRGVLPAAFAELLDQLEHYRSAEEMQKRFDRAAAIVTPGEAAPMFDSIFEHVPKLRAFQRKLFGRLYELQRKADEEKRQDEQLEGLKETGALLSVIDTAVTTRRSLRYDRAQALGDVPTKESVGELFGLAVQSVDLRCVVSSLQKIAEKRFGGTLLVFADKRVLVEKTDSERTMLGKLAEAAGKTLELTPDAAKTLRGGSLGYDRDFTSTVRHSISSVPPCVIKGDSLLAMTDEEAIEYYRGLFEDWLD